METRTYTVVIEPGQEGGFWADVPALPGCFTQGQTIDETVKMAQGAVDGFVEVLAQKGELIPVDKHQPRRVTSEVTVSDTLASMTVRFDHRCDNGKWIATHLAFCTGCCRNR